MQQRACSIQRPAWLCQVKPKVVLTASKDLRQACCQLPAEFQGPWPAVRLNFFSVHAHEVQLFTALGHRLLLHCRQVIDIMYGRRS
jgi:hypothetical protein